METKQIKYICVVKRWFDRLNGNTYHSVRITDIKTNKIYVGAFQYGYGTQYEQTALKVLFEAGLIKGYDEKKLYLYQRENKYPIEFIVSDGLKRDCVNNGIV